MHPVCYANTYAVLYNGDEVDIDEDDIRDYYDRSRITRELVSELSDDLHNEWIEYYEREFGITPPPKTAVLQRAIDYQATGRVA